MIEQEVISLLLNFFVCGVRKRQFRCDMIGAKAEEAARMSEYERRTVMPGCTIRVMGYTH